ncbi:glutaredoxin family protein [Gallaecimonas xiamenensis]|uniref:Glutaredoxin domain-containing protein n=1 Tax=Gallaecimonas xiamenensis 3-C-1 TaxID=745411 RepID=K2JXA3_9GAMM|nr:glutaredoxin family protein [Gallaecimonas xiamenensis]EKE69885.1 hypothetical protein B3C1_14395 [Gallaecimonas xiamenensis 3-C-1]
MRPWLWLLLLILVFQHGDSLKDMAQSHQLWPFEGAKAKLYTNDWCPACLRTDSLLEELEIPVDRVNLDYALEASQVEQRYGRGNLPILVIGDQVIRGFAPDRTKEAWHQAKAKGFWAGMTDNDDL